MSAEREQWPAAPAHATGTVQFVAVDDIAPDETFRLRADGDVSQLATALGRLGQLAPIELRPLPGAEPAAPREPSAVHEGAAAGPRWQVVSGFRRLAAVRMLARERVLARLHGELGEADAWGLALGEALLHEPLTGPELEVLRERLRAARVAPWAEELVDEALVRAPVAAELRERFYEFLTASAAAVAAPDAPAPSASASPFIEASPSTETAAAAAATTVPVPDSAAPTVATEATVASGPADYVEVTPDELVQDLVGRLAALNQDLATAVDAWEDLPLDGRKTVVEQARYVAALLPFMETKE